MTAVIPTLGMNTARLIAAVDAVWAQRGEFDLDVIVVVNGRALDETAALDARTQVLVAGINFGWSGGLHIGRASTHADFLWLVQDDSYPEESCLSGLLSALSSSPDLGLVTPMVVRTTPEHDDSPTVPYAYRGSWGGVLGENGSMDHWEPRRDTPLDEIGTIPDLDYVPSRGMLVRTSVWDEVGGTDLRSYPTGSVDVLLCLAVREAGHAIALTPTAHIRHDRSASTPPVLKHYVRVRSPRLVRERGMPVQAATEVVPVAVREAVLVSATSSFLELVEYVGRTMMSRDDHKRLKAQFADVSAELERVHRELDALRASRSWRVTAPMRKISSRLSRLRRPRS